MMVVGEIAARENRVDQGETRGWAVTHRDRRRAIQLDDRRGVHAQQHVIETHDLTPVGPPGVRGLRVDGRNRGLQCVRPESTGRERPFDEANAFRDLVAIPQRAILFMTGYDDASETEDPFAQEMVIKKPFKLVELAAAVERGLAVRDGERSPWNVTPFRQPHKR